MSNSTAEGQVLAKRIETARADKRMTLKSLSDSTGIPYPTLRRKLQQKPDTFTVGEVASIAVVLSVDFRIGYAA